MIRHLVDIWVVSPFLASVSNDAVTFMRQCLFEHLLSAHVGTCRVTWQCRVGLLEKLPNLFHSSEVFFCSLYQRKKKLFGSKKHVSQKFPPGPFLSVQLGSVTCIYAAVTQVPRAFLSCGTETLRLLAAAPSAPPALSL